MPTIWQGRSLAVCETSPLPPLLNHLTHTASPALAQNRIFKGFDLLLLLFVVRVREVFCHSPNWILSLFTQANFKEARREKGGLGKRGRLGCWQRFMRAAWVHNVAPHATLPSDWKRRKFLIFCKSLLPPPPKKKNPPKIWAENLIGFGVRLFSSCLLLSTLNKWFQRLCWAVHHAYNLLWRRGYDKSLAIPVLGIWYFISKYFSVKYFDFNASSICSIRTWLFVELFLI